ncbi:uncharacterized protein LOC105180509 [Harpegnathos saltator]|uniref:uncharacterized protein LOC105180509 n=1 Tax=Harpegnathos saltator TaxID=610380 RepID=UPI000DBEE82E|nr:uncharacterized protein LOC105180509 [Harpegnathos saltator]
MGFPFGRPDVPGVGGGGGGRDALRPPLHNVVPLPLHPQQVLARRQGEGNFSLPKRWALNRLDADKFQAAALVATRLDRGSGAWDPSPQEGARELVCIVASVCDAVMPRYHPRRHRAACWWTEAIADLHEASVRARRAYTRAWRDSGDAAREKEGYFQARGALKVTIDEAKKRAWEQLVSSLDEDPWGQERTVGKIRLWALPAMESLEPQVFLEGLLETLFPRMEGGPNPRPRVMGRGLERGPVGDSRGARKSQEKAREWGTAKLVLLPKEGKTPGTPYRPICLLDEAGKILKRIADRLVQYLSLKESNFHGDQYGFRPGQSTLGAI